MTESALRAQFEREYCEEFSLTPEQLKGIRLHRAFRMWKRAKLETRTVELKVWPNVFMQDRRYAFADDIKAALEKANIEVEFV